MRIGGYGVDGRLLEIHLLRADAGPEPGWYWPDGCGVTASRRCWSGAAHRQRWSGRTPALKARLCWPKSCALPFPSPAGCARRAPGLWRGMQAPSG
ncbi:hypothetical protein E6W36_05095 [Hankyongella ginsenosidimutans]|uniref:Uncharacterized protein n=1 Tax=Hankyongella ginsenosidimutans TaxID=1763828 RepID=A0A4D7BUB3_9SPHN|nr:hypothetical protein [Hankyongella ginsenosidimutans]QCI79159.1 hypothetical protein E6W36_05095 [Hankyongella ginsenosidimutans]